VDHSDYETVGMPKQCFPRWDIYFYLFHLFIFLLYIFCCLVVCVFYNTAALCVLINGWMHGWIKHADRSGYYKYTGDNIVPLISKLDEILHGNDISNVAIDELHDDIVYILTDGKKFVDIIKISINFGEMRNLVYLRKVQLKIIVWIAAGRPRSGPVFDSRQQSRMRYRTEQESTLTYTKDLHEALLRKNGVAFWICWRARFEDPGKRVEVDKCIDSDVLAGKFASHFCTAYTSMLRGRIEFYKNIRGCVLLAKSEVVYSRRDRYLEIVYDVIIPPRVARFGRNLGT